MKITALWNIIIAISLCTSCREQNKRESDSKVIGNGKMPNVFSISKRLHIVYGTGDSIMYVSSSNNGESFSSPELIAVLPQLASSHMRGPQIAGTENTLTVIACNKPGDIFSYTRDVSGKWVQGNKVNDVDTVSKEGLMALAADEKNAFAVWLDLRDKHNKIFGASSTDAGKTWSKNKLIYASPDTTVCECCKPSVIVNGDQVSIMFRNWLNGNRDLYLIQSNDNGNNFGAAQKLGKGNWELNGCPMDGGGLALTDDKKLQTVWHRKGKIYASEPGQEEKEIGAGKACTLTIAGKQTIYAWTENGEIICLLQGVGRKVIGKGQGPVIKAFGKDQFACIWESENQIKVQIMNL